ncbi:MAG: ParA family protein, partial [Nitrosopumilaceae archaeon]
MKSIAIFNNKGGVGKTSLLCNLAAYLALEKQKKILVIDADPQCNATQAMFSDDTISEIYERSGFTVYDIIRPLSTGKGFSEILNARESQHFGLNVIPGDPRLSLTEDLLATDWNDAISGKTRGIRTTLLFVELLTRCKDYDYVFFDMGPSLGSINRSVLIAADFFI